MDKMFSSHFDTLNQFFMKMKNNYQYSYHIEKEKNLYLFPLRVQLRKSTCFLLVLRLTFKRGCGWFPIFCTHLICIIQTSNKIRLELIKFKELINTSQILYPERHCQ